MKTASNTIDVDINFERLSYNKSKIALALCKTKKKTIDRHVSDIMRICQNTSIFSQVTTYDNRIANSIFIEANIKIL